MPQPRSQLTKADVSVVHRWVCERLRNEGWPRNWSSLTAWHPFPLDTPTAKTLQAWCDRFLNAPQWKQLYAVIRATRQDKSQTATLRRSPLPPLAAGR
jgi:hypothetical protein